MEGKKGKADLFHSQSGWNFKQSNWLFGTFLIGYLFLATFMFFVCCKTAKGQFGHPVLLRETTWHKFDALLQVI